MDYADKENRGKGYGFRKYNGGNPPHPASAFSTSIYDGAYSRSRSRMELLKVVD
jgi:hypothetical protein